MNNSKDWCPVCGSQYINEYKSTTFVVRQCGNHSWSSHLIVQKDEPPAFENVYRPLHDTKEPIKRLFPQ